MAATLSPVPKLQFFDANGAPLAGGKLYSYFAGTTTPQSTYTDSTGTTSNPNPVILDARGEAGVWLANDAFYKLSLYTSTNVLVWTVDQIASNTTLAALAASGGSALVGYLPAGTGAVETTVQTKLRESVSVKDFGAVGDGVTDDTAAILAAIAATSAGGQLNFVSGKTYILSNNINFGKTGVTLNGNGCTFKQVAGSQTLNWILISGATDVVIKDINFDGNRANTPSIDPDAASLTLTNGSDIDVINCSFYAAKAKGLSVSSGTSGSGIKRVRIIGCTAYNCGQQCMLTDRSNAAVDPLTIPTDQIIFDGCLIYSSDHAGLCVNDGSSNVTVSNCIIDVNNSTWDAISIRGSSNVTVSNCIGRRGRYGCGIETLDAAAVLRKEEAENIVLSGNIWEANAYNGVLAIGVIGLTINGDISKNNGQVGAGFGFNISQNASLRHSSYVNLNGVLAYDDQTIPTQQRGIYISASDNVNVTSPACFGNTVSNKVEYLSITKLSVIGDSSSGDGALSKEGSVTTGAIAATSQATVTFTFATPFLITPNWANAAVLFASGSRFLRIQQIVALTTTIIQVLVVNDGATSQTGTLYIQAKYLN